MRMLIIDEGFVIEGFAHLKEFAVPLLADGQRIKTEHRVDGEIGRPYLSLNIPIHQLGTRNSSSPRGAPLMVE